MGAVLGNYGPDADRAGHGSRGEAVELKKGVIMAKEKEGEVLSAWVLVKDKDGGIFLRPATPEDLNGLADRIMREMGLPPFPFVPGKPGQG